MMRKQVLKKVEQLGLIRRKKPTHDIFFSYFYTSTLQSVYLELGQSIRKGVIPSLHDQRGKAYPLKVQKKNPPAKMTSMGLRFVTLNGTAT